MVLGRGWFPLGLLMIGVLWGCAATLPPTSSSPFFTPTTEDATRLSRLTHELDKRALHCLEVSTCEDVHYARALISLFENQEAAGASFRRVINGNPSGALAASSRLWLQLIESEETQSTNVPQHNLMAQFVRDWMARELAESTVLEHPVTTTPKAIAEPLEMVKTLQKRVRERDRHIATLESKLEDLKVIDQDHEKRTRPIRLPGTLPEPTR